MQCPENQRYHFRLYSANRGPEMTALMERLREVMEQQLGERVRTEIIDVLEEPELAIEAEVFATPTLIKELPKPARRLLGDLSDPHKVIACFGLLEVRQDGCE